MYNSRKRPVEEVPEVLTPVWSCSSDDCNGWMRENFTFSEAPVCLLCHSPMERGERMLAAVVNTSLLHAKS